MKGASTQKASRKTEDILFDRELEELPPGLRWREWMLRVEAVIFASAEPVTRDTLAHVIGKDCSLDLLIDDLREELRDRPYELVSVAGGWQHRTRLRFGEAIRASSAPTRSVEVSLSEQEAAVLAAIAYHQPITRAEIGKIFGKDVSRDLIGKLRRANFIALGPRSPTPGAPYTYVTTKQFLVAFDMQTLRDLPNFEALEDAGLIGQQALDDDFGLGIADEEQENLEDQV